MPDGGQFVDPVAGQQVYAQMSMPNGSGLKKLEFPVIITSVDTENGVVSIQTLQNGITVTASNVPYEKIRIPE